ncbi:MAG: ABC transporter permease [Acidimicrobiales bacterium]
MSAALKATGRWSVAIVGALVIFGAFMTAKGVNPFSAYDEMFRSTFSSGNSLGEILIKASPILLAALAVTVPARAGLVNVGGEGQLVIGGVAAAGVSLALGDGGASFGGMLLMMLAAAAAGALLAAVAGALRLWVGINEAVTTLLLNYLAVDIMLYLIFDSWKDPNGSGQPATRALPVAERLPLIGTSRVHTGLFVALGAMVLVYLALGRTTWGFRLGVVGGNPEAARRSGYRVGLLLVGAIAVGGALAGLGGFVQLAGVEFKLRQGFLVGYGYIGFLASWLARHHPLQVGLGAVALAAIAVGGDSLQIDSGLPAAGVNILMALVLLAVFGWTRTKAVRA